MMNEARLLIVDDEMALMNMLETLLLREGISKIDKAETASQALALCKSHTYDLILLDVMLPDQTGFEICPSIREQSDATIFFLTAKAGDLDKLSGFAVGADDYITKPFNPLEVVARIKAHLTRRLKISTIQDQTVHSCGPIEMNTSTGEVFVRGEAVRLPAQVYQLLLFFCKHPNQLFSKGQLYEQVWGDAFMGEDNTVMVHIRKLREKIEEDPGNPELILTVRGLGYKLDIPRRSR